MIGVYIDPEGEKVFKRTQRTSAQDSAPMRNNSNGSEPIETLKLRVRELETILSLQSDNVS